MVWSKIKKQIKEFIVADLKKRIDIYCTSYSKAHDDVGEAWITVDKEKIAGGGYCHWQVAEMPEELRNDSAITYAYNDEYFSPIIKNENILKIMNLGIHETSHITRNLGIYINTPFDILLKSNNPIYKAFAIVDKRLGKKRFLELEIKENDHVLVKNFYELRRDCFEKQA
jgi:hypothetical protein